MGRGSSKAGAKGGGVKAGTQASTGFTDAQREAASRITNEYINSTSSATIRAENADEVRSEIENRVAEELGISKKDAKSLLDEMYRSNITSGQQEKGDYIDSVTVKGRDENGKSVKTTASIQDLGNMDRLADTGVRFQHYETQSGMPGTGAITRKLASMAEDNTLNKDRKGLIDLNDHESKAKEGKFTKINNAPALIQGEDALTLKTGEGFITKSDGNTFYVTKAVNSRTGEPTKGYVTSYKGIVVSKYSSLQKAKEGVKSDGKKVTELFNNSSNNAKQLSDSMFAVLNKNKGKVARDVWKEINMKYVGNSLY